MKNYLKAIHSNRFNETKLGNDFYYPVAAICEEDLEIIKECNILKYNIFDESNIRRDIYLKKSSSGELFREYQCTNVPGLRSLYKSQFVLNKNLTENNMLWKLREKRTSSEDPILISINIEAGLNPRNIKNQFNMCDRDPITNEIKCRSIDENMEDVDFVDSAHETAPQCMDDLDLGSDADFWSCDGVVLTEGKEPKILDETIYVGNQEFRKSYNGYEMVIDSNMSYTIEFQGEIWEFSRKIVKQVKVLGKSVSQNIFGQWVGVCDDWKNLNSECGPHKYYKINSPAKQKKDCSLILDYNNFIPMQFNATTNLYQGSMGAYYEAFHSAVGMTWSILSKGAKSTTFKTADFGAACPDDIDYLLKFNDGTDLRNDRLWIPDTQPFPSGSPEVYDHLEYPWEHYRNDVISYCHGTCDQISVAISLNGTREVLTFHENKWIGGDYELKLTHVDNTSHSVHRLYKISSRNIIASSEVNFKA